MQTSIIKEITPLNNKLRTLIITFLCFSFFSLLSIPANAADASDGLRSLYLPISSITERRLKQLIHFSKQADFNAFVIHMKSPKGKVFWASKNKIANEIGAVSTYYDISAALKLLKKEQIYTIAKVDIFADHLLAKKHPEMAVSDINYGEPWLDKSFLYWTNPYDNRVRKYNIELMKELVELGFDEIQLDYIRFPSDGIMSDVYYPVEPKNTSKSDAISSFLKDVNSQLKPLGTTISVDLFGMTAWFKNDFKIGQILEKIAPHVDVVCPMLYPSHFPKGFNGWRNPNAIPEKVMFQSMQHLKKRGQFTVRPWLQGFWYKPDQIIAQVHAMQKSETTSWAVWNASGNYSTTFKAIAKMKGFSYTPPDYYASMEELSKLAPNKLDGKYDRINLTDYQKQYSVISLEESKKNYKSPYRSLVQVIATLDEAIMDEILTKRGTNSPEYLTKTRKVLILSKLVIKDLHIKPNRMRSFPIYIGWGNKAVFTKNIPKDIS